MLERCKPVVGSESLQARSGPTQSPGEPAPLTEFLNFLLSEAVPLAIWSGAILPRFFAGRIPWWSWLCIACIAYLLFRYVIEYPGRIRKGGLANASTPSWEKFRAVNKAIHLEDMMRRTGKLAKAGEQETVIASARYVPEGLGL